MTLGSGLECFLFVFARLSCALVLVPPLGEGRTPRLALVCLALWTTLVVAGTRTPIQAATGADFLAALAAEACLGLLLGFVVRLALLPLEVLGEYLSHEAGLAMPATLDPTRAAPSTAFFALARALAFLLFLALGGLESSLRMLGRSFELLAPGAAGRVALRAESLAVVPEVFARAFQAAFELALPVVVAALLGTVTIAILARAVPRLNLFTDVFPLRTVAACGALLIFLPLTARATAWLLGQVTDAAPLAVLGA
ncbi:MAG: type III secretion protein [Planctomycetota bacterium]|nr:MAG: type III secretion protein [Planctomycetota bacterium]